MFSASPVLLFLFLFCFVFIPPLYFKANSIYQDDFGEFKTLSNRRRYMDGVCLTRGFDPLLPSNWYSVRYTDLLTWEKVYLYFFITQIENLSLSLLHPHWLCWPYVEGSNFAQVLPKQPLWSHQGLVPRHWIWPMYYSIPSFSVSLLSSLPNHTHNLLLFSLLFLFFFSPASPWRPKEGVWVICKIAGIWPPPPK